MPGNLATLGIDRPNLVVVFDNEKRFEFRVQCELPLMDETVAMRLVRQLQSDQAAQLREAKETVLGIVKQNKNITPVSRKIIETAFDASIDYLREKPKKP